MMISWSEAALIALAIPLSFTAVQVGASSYRRLRSYVTAQCIRRISTMVVAEAEPNDREIRSLRTLFTMDVMLDSVIFVAEKIYGDALNRLTLIVEVCELDYHLLRAIRRGRGERRTRRLSQLSYLTYATMVAESAELYMEEKRRSTRFCAMAALVASRPSRAVLYISRFKDVLSLHEVAVLVRLMRRAGAAIAYTPLLCSPNRNLQIVGIYLCCHFSITDAESHLQRLVESEDVEVANLALQTLCSIHGDLSTRQVSGALRRLLPHQRIAFVMRAVHNCYSLRSCAHLLTREEQRLFLQRTNSYKCQIVCN